MLEAFWAPQLEEPLFMVPSLLVLILASPSTILPKALLSVHKFGGLSLGSRAKLQEPFMGLPQVELNGPTTFFT